MQTSQNDTTTAATTNAAPTLAELLAARAAEVEEAEREQAQHDEHERQCQRLDARAHGEQWVEGCLTPQLADALRVHIGVDEQILAAENDEYDPARLASYIDLAALELEEEQRAERVSWFIRLELYPLQGYYYTLHGPNHYAAMLPHQPYRGARLDAYVLDTIAAYPDWMAHAEQRAEEQRRKQAEKEEQEERRKRERPRHFAYVDGTDGPDGTRPILRAGNHLQVATLDPSEANGIMVWSGVLQSYTEHWLLLNLNGVSPRSLGAQRLIPVARVLEIQPLPDLAPNVETPNAE